MTWSDDAAMWTPPDQTPATTSAPPPKPPILSTPYTQIPSAANGDGVPWPPPPEAFDPSGMTPVPMPGAPASISAAAKTVAGLISGDTSVEHPEIPPLNLQGLGLDVTDSKGLAILAHMAVSRDPVALQNVIHERLPDAKFTNDAQGNTIVQVPGGPQMYVDRPGLTPQKVLFYGPQTVASVASGGSSVVGVGVRQAIQHALSQLGSWGLGGADSPIDLQGTAIAGLAPMALGGLGVAGIKAADWLMANPGTTNAAEIAARANSLNNWGFSGKEGDITADPGTLAAEDRIANAGSDSARTFMKQVQDSNSAKNLDNKRMIVGNVSGDVPPGQPVPDSYVPDQNAFGDTLNKVITDKVTALTDAEKAGWDKLGPVSTSSPAGKAVTFAPGVSSDVLAAHDDTMDSFFGAPQGPAGTYTADQLAAMGDGGKRLVAVRGLMTRTMQGVDADGNPNLQGFNLGQLQDMRQQLGGVINDAPGTQASAAAMQMKRALDDAISKAEMTPGQMNGDPATLTAFRAANAATRDKYNFTQPANNPAATKFIANVTKPDTPATGGQSINAIFGTGGRPVNMTPSVNGILTHLEEQLGDGATKPLAGALTTRTLYGGQSPEAAADAPPQSDYTSTRVRIGSQLSGTGSADVADRLLPDSTQASLQDYAKALDVLGTASRPGMMRLNAPGSGYQQLLTGPMEDLPVIGPTIRRMLSMREAKSSMQAGGELQTRAAAGANTPEGLGVTTPYVSALNNPKLPFYSWRPQAFKAGVPAYQGGGLLFGQENQPPTAQNIRGP